MGGESKQRLAPCLCLVWNPTPFVSNQRQNELAAPQMPEPHLTVLDLRSDCFLVCSWPSHWGVRERTELLLPIMPLKPAQGPHVGNSVAFVWEGKRERCGSFFQ